MEYKFIRRAKQFFLSCIKNPPSLSLTSTFYTPAQQPPNPPPLSPLLPPILGGTGGGGGIRGGKGEKGAAALGLKVKDFTPHNAASKFFFFFIKRRS